MGLLLLTLSTQALLAQSAETYELVPEESSIAFKVRKHGVTWVDGTFKKFEGKGQFDPQDPARTSIEVKVEAASVDTANEKRDNALRGDEYFKTSTHPHLTFRSTSVKRGEDGSFVMEGEFTLLGVTKTIQVPVTWGEVWEKDGASYRTGESSFTIKRSEYGMTANPVMIGDEIQVSLKLTGKRQ